MYIHSMECCGLREIGGLSAHHSSENAMRGFIKSYFGYTYRAFNDLPVDLDITYSTLGSVIFTEAGNRVTYGKRFAKYIEENGLGTVVALPGFRNPNSGNIVRTYFWTVDRHALQQWYSNQRGR